MAQKQMIFGSSDSNVHKSSLFLKFIHVHCSIIARKITLLATYHKNIVKLQSLTGMDSHKPHYITILLFCICHQCNIIEKLTNLFSAHDSPYNKYTIAVNSKLLSSLFNYICKKSHDKHAIGFL